MDIRLLSHELNEFLGPAQSTIDDQFVDMHCGIYYGVVTDAKLQINHLGRC